MIQVGFQFYVSIYMKRMIFHCIVFPNGKSLLIYEDDIKESGEDEEEGPFEL